MEEIDASQLEKNAATFAKSSFGGMLSSTVQSIQCTHSTTREQRFCDIEITIPSSSAGGECDSDVAISIEDCLDRHFEAEALDQWLCE